MTQRTNHTVARWLARSSLVLGTLAVISSAFVWYLTTPPKGDSAEVSIPSGSSVRAVAHILREHNLIRSPLIFTLYVRLRDIELQAGEYKLTPTRISSLARELTQGREDEVKITIPEGYRVEQIAQVAGLPVSDLLVAVKGKEGQLFPDTYFVSQDITAPELVERMHDNFITKVGEIDKETLILASLVERETKGGDEKPVVAGILKKRLEAGWALELDATIQYILGNQNDWWPTTTLADRQIKSPYNTYLYAGLPPEPICNPGLASIQAVQHAKDSPYWFYLHDRDGIIRYAVTNEEHAKNIAVYIR